MPERARKGVPTLEPTAFRGTDLDRAGTVAVAFVADWCPFCRRFDPEFAELQGQGFELARADLSSESSSLWDDFHIEVVPTVIVFRDGRTIFRADGRYGHGLDERDMSAIVAAARSPGARAT